MDTFQTNFICFLVPDSKLIANTLALTEFGKIDLVSSCIRDNGYNKVVEFVSGSSAIIISSGIKDIAKLEDIRALLK